MSDMRHRFTLTTPAGEECEGCGVTVEDESLLHALSIGCPSGGCSDPANRGEACVFVRAGDGRLECSYCERAGGDQGDDDTDLDWFYALDGTPDTSESVLDNFGDGSDDW